MIRFIASLSPESAIACALGYLACAIAYTTQGGDHLMASAVKMCVASVIAFVVIVMARIHVGAKL